MVASTIVTPAALSHVFILPPRLTDYSESTGSVRRLQDEPRLRSSNVETLLVQERPVLSPELDPPAAGARIEYCGAAKGAVSGVLVGPNRKLHRLLQPVSPKPTMLDCRVARA